jgi:hypothetical protein
MTTQTFPLSIRTRVRKSVCGMSRARVETVDMVSTIYQACTPRCITFSITYNIMHANVAILQRLLRSLYPYLLRRA